MSTIDDTTPLRSKDTLTLSTTSSFSDKKKIFTSCCLSISCGMYCGDNWFSPVQSVVAIPCLEMIMKNFDFTEGLLIHVIV